MNALQNIPEHQKPEFMRSLETMQMKDSLKMYNNLVEQCFAHCVAARDGVSERARRTAASFRSKALDKKEDECICRCAEKYIKLTQRGFRLSTRRAGRRRAPQAR
ncbi:hypothetical protein JL720_15215 [Aureococcus anophagefferens]|nr:hypothetical protein JL720_15215 [Aureococcus anophagefferens]